MFCRASAQDMLRFHSEEYIEFLQQVTPQNIHCNCKLSFHGLSHI